jgi:hypothetical protein
MAKGVKYKTGFGNDPLTLPRRSTTLSRPSMPDSRSQRHRSGTRVPAVKGRAPGQPTSLERINWVIALDDEPIRRNLLITQTYNDLSAALAESLGACNANWCTFATWASRTAGKFIREEEIPAVFHGLLGHSEPAQLALARANAALARVRSDAIVDEDSLLAVVRDVVHDVSRLITAGNLAVFGELGPIFSQVVDALAARADATALDTLSESLKPGLSTRGGQSMLRSALQQYAAAYVEHDARRKAALMLLANGQVGLHEQIRLQPFIAGSIDAPIREAFDEVLEESGEAVTGRMRHAVHALVSRLLHPVADAASSVWEEFATRELMTLSLPDGELVLGEDLPTPPGGSLYPAVLDPIDGVETVELLDQYGADRPGKSGTAAVDWARLSDRMRYILDLFRSRQCDPSLMTEPFTPDERTAILDGTIQEP